MSKSQAEIKNMSFEDALGELQDIVKGLESGETTLDNSIKAYERGVALKTHCEAKLKEARSKIEKITVTREGTVKTEPFNEQE